MTDIAGVVYWNGRPVKPTLMESVNTCMRHRSPDGSWVWTEGPVGLAQADLATLPEDEPGVPVARGQLRIAASCRIDNRDDIIRAVPHEFRPQSNTDAACILAAYQTWGARCVERLIGDFAFIIWDGGKQCFFVARDISGVRPLYYYADANRLFIASDRTQILQEATVPLEVDEEQLIEYLTPTYKWYSGWNQGFFRGFHALPAGSVLQAQRGDIAVRSFWEWRDRGPNHRPAKLVLEEYLHTLDESVHCRLRSRSSVAIELSGGLDSSAVACLAARLPNESRPDLHTFSGVYDEVREMDERCRIQVLLEHYPQLSPHFLISDKLRGLPQYFNPDWSPRSVIGIFEMGFPRSRDPFYELIEEANCRVILTGWMGDMLNYGSGRVYFDLLRSGRFQEARRWFAIHWHRSKKKALWRLFVYGLVPLMAPHFLLRIGYWGLERRSVDLQLPPYFPAPLQRRIQRTNQAIQWRREQDIRVRCPVTRETLLLMFPPPWAVSSPVDRPLENRHPYFDRRLVELVLSMPPDLKWDPHERGVFEAGRLHHRQALLGILPEAVRVKNIGPDASPVLRRSFSLETLQDWLMSSDEVHIFNRGYVQSELFLDELAKLARPKGDTEEHFNWICIQSWIMTMFGIEAWLRALAPGGSMRRLVPPRASQ